MFHKMASSFDESSTAGVFLPVLFSQDSRCELLFPSYMTLLQSRPAHSPPPPQTVSLSPPFMGEWGKKTSHGFSVSQLLTVESLLFVPLASLQRSQEKSAICPSLQDFSFTSWNPEQVTHRTAHLRLGPTVSSKVPAHALSSCRPPTSSWRR